LKFSWDLLQMAEKEKFLGEFEQTAMLALIQLKDNAYGAAIRQLLHEQVTKCRHWCHIFHARKTREKRYG
jgi:hypothetical protein